MNRMSNTVRKFLVLVILPAILISAYILFMLPQLLTSINQQTVIPASGLFSDMPILELSIEPSIENLDISYFTTKSTMNLYIKENATIETGYNLIVIPMGYDSGSHGVGVPFQNLPHEYPAYVINSTQDWEWITCDKYSYSENLQIPIAHRFPERFPADHYLSSTIYVWFSGSFYPEVKLSPASSVPRGFILTLSQPRLVDPTDFYLNILPPLFRLAYSKPANRVLAFEIGIQRDSQSLQLYVIYIAFLLLFTYEILAISRLKVKQLKDKINIFVGLAIASIAFLWSIRLVVNVMTFSEILLATIIAGWLLLEIKDALRKK